MGHSDVVGGVDVEVLVAEPDGVGGQHPAIEDPVVGQDPGDRAPVLGHEGGVLVGSLGQVEVEQGVPPLGLLGHLDQPGQRDGPRGVRAEADLDPSVLPVPAVVEVGDGGEGS